MAVAPGTRLGPYDIVAPIGSGGMGEVYRARDSRLGREVAVKVLPHGLLEAPDALVRFEREARAVAAHRASSDAALRPLCPRHRRARGPDGRASVRAPDAG
jgi:serine/threonine protein kinase